MACTLVTCAGVSGHEMGKCNTKRTGHLLCGHADRLDCKFAPAHIEEVLQIWTEKVDNEKVMQAFLTKIVHLRNSRCGMNGQVSTVTSKEEGATHEFRSSSYMSEIHHGVEVHQIFEVPTGQQVSALCKQGCCVVHTNFMATG